MNSIERKVRKSRNSVIVTLPESILKELNVEKGDTVSFEVEEGAVKLKKAPVPVVKDDILSLMEEIYKENEETFRVLVEK